MEKSLLHHIQGESYFLSYLKFWEKFYAYLMQFYLNNILFFQHKSPTLKKENYFGEGVGNLYKFFFI